MMYNEKMLESFSKEYAERCQVTDKITAEMFDANGVLRGLRDKTGNGVVAGLTNISKIEAFRNSTASADKFYERCHYESTECRSDEFPDQKCTDTGIL